MQPFGSILPIAIQWLPAAGHVAAPSPVGAGALSDVFDEIAKERKLPFDFGIYEHLTRSQAASGRGIVANAFVIRCLAKVAPAGQIQHRVEASVRDQGLA